MKQYSINRTEKLERALNDNGFKLIKYDFFGNQFKTCQAWEINGEIENLTTGEILNVKILQSYNTLVSALINGLLIRGKFSSTTSKQITQWSNCYNVQKEVRF